MEKKAFKEKGYIFWRLCKAKCQSLLFYMFRVCPIDSRKVVFCCIEGTTGYSCNPKYIAAEFMRRKETGYQLVWLVNDISKKFPEGIIVKKNTLWNRAYQLSTAKIWIDNSRKQLEVRKRKGQLYIQTWHAKIGFKPTCLDRGASFSEIAYLVSKHDSEMIDYVLSNSKWYDDSLATGMIYEGKTLRTGSPRCDILVNNRDEWGKRIRQKFNLPADTKLLLYAPTFRGGSQGIKRELGNVEHMPNFEKVLQALRDGLGGEWYCLLRLHPQLTVRNIGAQIGNGDLHVIDVSKEDDMYELLAGSDAYITDYSSAAFDAAAMRIPIFLYADDYEEYIRERGNLLFDLRKLPFPFADSNDALERAIKQFDNDKYQKDLKQFFCDTDMVEDGKASERVVSFIREWGQDE